jgi:RNA polymerase sigma-70 factor (ECF subfamily)
MRKSRDQIYNELLVIKSQQGDKEAFNELVGRWQKQLWNYAYRVTGAESAAWDIVQESWHGIIKGIKKLDDAAVFGRWAIQIVNNKCMDWLRKQKQQYKLDDELLKNSRDESGEMQNNNDKSESLLYAVRRLSPERRTLLMLRYQQGFDIEQIAQIINVPAGTVKSRLHRTLEKLKEIIERLKDE